MFVYPASCRIYREKTQSASSIAMIDARLTEGRTRLERMMAAGLVHQQTWQVCAEGRACESASSKFAEPCASQPVGLVTHTGAGAECSERRESSTSCREARHASLLYSQ